MLNSRNRYMPRLRHGVSAIALTAMVVSSESFAQSDDNDDRLEIDEIIVTARKRSETLQDVPISIKAITTEQIRERGIVNFEDYANFLPSVSYGTTAPGASTIVFRGAVAQPSGFGGRSSATLYLDEQPVTADGQNPDIRAVDIERIEALSGPQPTTFGAGSQSGTLRILTNNPNTQETEGFVEASVNAIEDGGVGYDVSGAVNLPLVEDKFAVRLVGFLAEEAGFIDNVLGETTGNSSNSITANNADMVEKNYNDTQVYGGRIKALAEFSEDWSLLGSLNYQNTEANGLNNFEPGVGDLDVVRFANEFRNDEWYQAALTLKGNLGFAELTSTSSLFSRDIAYDFDNTAYIARFQDQNQYLATSYYGVTINPDFCAAPYYYGGYAFLCSYDTATTRGQMVNRQTVRAFTHETRLTSTNEDSRFQWLVGAFYNRNRGKFAFELNQFDRPASPSVQNMHVAYLGFAAPGVTAFASNSNTLTKEIAVFGEATFEVTDKLEVTGGARWLEYEIDSFYDQFYLEFYNFNTLDGVVKDDEVVTMANIKYKFNDDAFVYFTRSEGIRNGGVENLPPRSTLGTGLNFFDSDKLTNYELGVKSTLMDGRLTANVTAFHQSWDDFQLQLEDATTTAFGIVTQNIGSATMKGIEGEFALKASQELELSTAFTLIDAQSDVTVPFGDTGLIAVSKGERLPTVADFKMSASAQYTTDMKMFGNDAEGVFRFDFTHVGDSTNGIPGSIFLFGDTGAAPQIQESYNLGNLSMVVKVDDFDFSLKLSNVWDERAQLFIHPRFNDNRSITNVPRNITFGVRKNF